jgi:hypothetical protein
LENERPQNWETGTYNADVDLNHTT